MAWRVWSKPLFTLTLLFGGSFIVGCTWFPTSHSTEVTQPSLEVSAGGWLLANEHEVWTVDASGTEGEPYQFSATVKGVLIQPVSQEALVFLEEQETWTVWRIGDTSQLIYSTKVPLGECSLAPNGHALVCVQQGDLNLIQLTDGTVERLETGVAGVIWSPNNSDLLVQFSDRIELVGLDLQDHVASRTVLVNETSDHPQFMNMEQVVWWKTGETERELVLFSLRTKELKSIWTGPAGTQSWVSSKGNRILFSDQDACLPSCITQLVSLPQGQILQSVEQAQAAGWLGQDPVVKTAIDQGGDGTYHFATVTDGTQNRLGEARFLATTNLLEIQFEP